MLEYFKNGGVFLFDEDNLSSEETYYRLEDLMGEEAGASITQTEVDEDGILCIFYDGDLLSEEEALDKYNKGDFKVAL